MTDSNSAARTTPETAQASQSGAEEVIQKGNRKVVTDFYVPNDVSSDSEKFAFKIFVRLNANKKRFKKVSFQHCVFESCYFNTCIFDSCDFTGCRFVGSNLHRSVFSGCDFRYASFERSEIGADILASEAPREENLRMRFARSLRMNYQQLGDARAVNKAISLELQATSIYLYKSWASAETYYKENYPGLKKVWQFIKWSEFWTLDFVWGNGENILKLIRTMLIGVGAIAIYDAGVHGDALNIRDYLPSLENAAAVFLGISHPSEYPTWALSVITLMRYVAVALLAALLVKRFGRR